MKKILARIVKPFTLASTLVLFAAVVLAPLVMLPIGDNFLTDSKVGFLVGVAFLIALFWTVITFARKSLQITLSPFLLPLAVIGASVGASIALNQTTLPLSQLYGFGGVLIAFVTVGLLAPSLIEEKYGKLFGFGLVLSSILLSVTTAAQYFQVGPSRFFNFFLKTQFPSSAIFSLASSPLVAAEVLAVGVVFCLAHVLTHKKKSNPLFVLAGLISVAGLVTNIVALIEVAKTTPILLPYSASASIALDVMKDGKSAIIGVGPDNFLQTFMLLKPAWINSTSFWNVQFAQGSNVPLGILVTMGLFGLGAWLFFVLRVIQAYLKSSPEGKIVASAVLATVVIQLLLPINPVILTLQVLGLVFWTATEKNRLKDIQLHAFTIQITKSGAETQKVPQHSNLMVYLISGFSAVVLAVAAWFWISPYYIGQYFMFRASIATLQNNAISTYNFQQKAIQFNPYLASYRRSYSNTNMAIALALSQAKDASDAEKTQVITLVEQAVREAKTSTVLEPANSTNWLNLGRIYSNLIGSADNADKFTIQAYSQAVTYAPTDPVLNLEAGGVLYRVKLFNQAVQLFEKTVTLKPDWPNAYYNLANAYRENKEPERSAAAYQQTLSILQSQGKTNSDDYKKVSDELGELVRANTPTPTTPTAPVVPKKKVEAPATLLAPTASSAGELNTTEGGLQNVAN